MTPRYVCACTRTCKACAFLFSPFGGRACATRASVFQSESENEYACAYVFVKIDLKSNHILLPTTILPSSMRHPYLHQDKHAHHWTFKDFSHQEYGKVGCPKRHAETFPRSSVRIEARVLRVPVSPEPNTDSNFYRNPNPNPNSHSNARGRMWS